MRLDIDGLAFGLLGIGVGWALADTVVTNLPLFMQCLPGGLYLPDQVGLAATLTQGTSLLVWRLYTTLFGVPSFRGHVAFIWTCLSAEMAGSLLVAAFWRVTASIGNSQVAIVVIVGNVIGAAIGTLSWAAVIPFISTHYPEHLISAFYTGSTSGSLLAGLLGLIQGAAPAFGPAACLGTLAICLCASIAAWIHILRHVRPRHASSQCNHIRAAAVGLTTVSSSPVSAAPCQPDDSHGGGRGAGGGGRRGAGGGGGGGGSSRLGFRPAKPIKEVWLDASSPTHPDAEASGAAQPEAVSASSAASPRPEQLTDGAQEAAAATAQDGMPAAAARPRAAAAGDEPGRVPRWVWLSLPCWAMALPMNMTTWGFSPNIVNIAAAHAGCSCDPQEPSVTDTLRITVSLAYMAMPFSAWLSYVKPTHDLRYLGALAGVQALAFGTELLGAANVTVMSCSAAARTTLGLCVITMRCTDTYVTAMLFRAVTQRTATDPKAQQSATLVFGQLLVVATLAAGLLAVFMVDAGAIICRLGDGSESAGNQTGIPQPLAACS